MKRLPYILGMYYYEKSNDYYTGRMFEKTSPVSTPAEIGVSMIKRLYLSSTSIITTNKTPKKKD